MNIYINVDLEGISGVYCTEQQMYGESKYSEAREYMTRDVNTCVAACKAAGVDKIYVRDAHSAGKNLIWDKLSNDIDYVISGIIKERRFADVISECDAVILLGYHAMAGTYEAVLDHTMNQRDIQNVWINGKKSGEMGIDSAILSDMGIPIIMVSGDDKTCKEAQDLIPGVVTAEVKKGTDRNGAMLLPPEKAQKVIYEKTLEAISKINDIKPVVYSKPVEVKIELTVTNQIPQIMARPYMKVIDGRTIAVEADLAEEAWYRCWKKK